MNNVTTSSQDGVQEAYSLVIYILQHRWESVCRNLTLANGVWMLENSQNILCEPTKTQKAQQSYLCITDDLIRRIWRKK